MYSNKEKSLIDRVLKASLELARMKEKNTYAQFRKMNDKCRPPRLMETMFAISSRETEGRAVWTLAPKQARNEYHVLFLHGGAYVVNMTPAHWFFVGALVDKLKCTVVVPDYPLTPDHDVEDVFDMMVPVYRELADRVGMSRLTLMGDSAGGGMALALCQLLYENKSTQPSQLFLLSPWLDVHMDNPEIKDLDAKDPVLNIRGLIDSGKAYAGERDRSDYLVSPIYGSLEGLPPVHCYVGTHEIMLPDARRFRDKANEFGLECHYHEIEGLIHDGMLFPTPEGKICREMIFTSIKTAWRKPPA